MPPEVIVHHRLVHAHCLGMLDWGFCLFGRDGCHELLVGRHCATVNPFLCLVRRGLIHHVSDCANGCLIRLLLEVEMRQKFVNLVVRITATLLNQHIVLLALGSAEHSELEGDHVDGLPGRQGLVEWILALNRSI